MRSDHTLASQREVARAVNTGKIAAWDAVVDLEVETSVLKSGVI